MNDTPTPRTERLYKLAIYELPYDTNYRANYQVWKTVKILKEHMERFERERDEAREQRDRLAEAMQTIIRIYENPDKGCIPCSSDMYDVALQSLNQDHSVEANDMIAAVKGGNHES